MSAKIYRLPKTNKKHVSWTDEEREALRSAYQSVKGNVPDGWYEEQARIYGRTKTAILKQLHPSQMRNYNKPSAQKISPTEKPIDVESPVRLAQHTFIGRWKEEGGNYWIRLYGQWNPVGLHEFIRAANVIRKARGELLIKGCDKWEP